MSARIRDHEDNARITPGRIQRKQVRLAYGVVNRVDAQQRAPHVRDVATAGAVSMILLLVWKGTRFRSTTVSDLREGDASMGECLVDSLKATHYCGLHMFPFRNFNFEGSLDSANKHLDRVLVR